MTWFAAHIVIGMMREDGIGPVSVYENVILIEAKSANEAHLMASKVGETEAQLDDGLTIDDNPAKRVFAGVRKIISVSNPDPYDLDQDQPTTGTEITYSEFEVADEAALLSFAKGEAVDVRYLE